MNLPFHQVHAFTREPGRGNPAGVYLLPEGPLYAPLPEDEYLQLLAIDRRLPETGFVRPRPEGYSLRWFTPKTELTLCGHGTLAAAHVLWEQGLLAPAAPAYFYTAAGLLTVRLLGEGWIEMDFPAFSFAPSTLPQTVTATFGAHEVYYAGDRHMVVLGSEAEVRNYAPDFEVLKDHRLIITAAASAAGGSYDFVSRYFGVPLGVNEDPVTGSAHCALAPYWAARLGKTHLNAYQASARGGALKLRLEGDRVKISGQAITV
jgi:PhzF family phenazine biosynthesis protein